MTDRLDVEKRDKKGLLSRTLKYSTALERDVPRRTDKFDHNDPMCWHCGEFPRIKTEYNSIIWCERCYLKLHEKMDGTYIQSDSVPALLKLIEDHKAGKLKDVPLASIDARSKFVDESK